MVTENGINIDLLERASGTPQSSLEGIIDFEYPEFPNIGTMRHYILGTEFKKFSVVWSCMDLPSLVSFDQSREFMFILTRSLEPSQDNIDEIESYIDKYFDRKFAVLTNQTIESCPIR